MSTPDNRVGRTHRDCPPKFGLSVGWESSSTFSAKRKSFVATNASSWTRENLNVTVVNRLYRTGSPAGGTEETVVEMHELVPQCKLTIGNRRSRDGD